MTNKLIEGALGILNHMSRFNLTEEDLISEGKESPDWMPENLHNFLFHLSSPSDPTGNKTLNEATVFDIKRGDRPGSHVVHPAMNLPRTKGIIDKGRETMPDGNLHKRIGEGFRAAHDAMEKETPQETALKLRESKAVFQKFAQDRGYKAGTSPKILRGNLKTQKSSGEGVLTTGLNLAPHTTSGLDNFNTCPKASKECKSGCLGLTAGGNRQYPDDALASKVLRTHFIAQHPEHAARIIDRELENHSKRAKKLGMIPGVRMNITSDLAWEHHAPKMFERHPDIQFYDYTKMPNRVMKSLAPRKKGKFHNEQGHPANYHLTLSHTGTGHEESNDKDVIKVLDHGGTVASVFQRGKHAGGLPTHIEDVKTGKRYPVKNGDDDDNTFDRPKAVSGLMLKGIKNEEAGHFANKVDEDGIARINK